MDIRLPKEVSSIISSLESEGFEAFAVGGCIRDVLLNREPKDWDITTSASPEQIKQIFPVTIDTGIEHGTVTVRKNKKSFEVTTYRNDGEYEDGRHPKSVTFVSDLKEDLRRRDFTINALAYNEKTGLVDEFGGLSDLRNKIIRCVDDPKKRFTEDALRMMRAVRFVAQLGFDLDPDTEAAIVELSGNLDKISVERISDELVKLLCSSRPDAMFLLSKTGLSATFLPEWDKMLETTQNTKHHRGSVGEHTVFVIEGTSPTKVMRLAALLHDVAKPVCKRTDAHGNDHFVGHPQIGAKMANEILRRLKFDNDTIGLVCRMVRYHDDRPPMTIRNVRRCINRMGEDILPYLFELRRADILGQSDYLKEEKLADIDEFENLYQKIKENQQCTDLKGLAISGNDVMALGVKKGPVVGELLKMALELVIDKPELNTEEFLKDYILQEYRKIREDA